MKIAPSIIACDFSKLEYEIRSVEDAGADLIHLDVMDGHFVPNITIGPVVIEGIRKLTKLPLDAHLMISEPERYVSYFVNAGCDMISAHVETLKEPFKFFGYLSEKKIRTGIALNPETPVHSIDKFLKYVDYILIMLVHPGFYGQKMIKGTIGKVKSVREITDKEIEVDGGINGENVKELIKLGADIIVSGAYIFKSNDRKKAIESLRYYE
jgi:ribulose-phosphate 3-epimerase